MKNVRFGLFILASACLICMLAPCALAQEGGDDPCCFNVPSAITSSNISAVQLLYASPMDQLSAPVEVTVPDQMLSGMTAVVTGKASGMPFLSEARKLNYVR